MLICWIYASGPLNLSCMLNTLENTTVAKQSEIMSTYRNLSETKLQLIDAAFACQEWSFLQNEDPNNAYELFRN